MRQEKSSFKVSSIVAAILLTGCGGGVDDHSSLNQPASQGQGQTRASALGTQAVALAGDAGSRSADSTAAFQSDTGSVATAAEPTALLGDKKSKLVYSLGTVQAGLLRRQLASTGWNTSGRTALTSVPNASSSLVTIHLQDPLARSAGFIAWLRDFKGTVIFDSSSHTAAPNHAGAHFNVANIDALNNLGADYLSTVLGIKNPVPASAYVVVRGSSVILPIHIDHQGRINGYAASAFFDRVNVDAWASDDDTEAPSVAEWLQSLRFGIVGVDGENDVVGLAQPTQQPGRFGIRITEEDADQRCYVLGLECTLDDEIRPLSQTEERMSETPGLSDLITEDFSAEVDGASMAARSVASSLVGTTEQRLFHAAIWSWFYGIASADYNAGVTLYRNSAGRTPWPSMALKSGISVGDAQTLRAAIRKLPAAKRNATHRAVLATLDRILVNMTAWKGFAGPSGVLTVHQAQAKHAMFFRPKLANGQPDPAFSNIWAWEKPVTKDPSHSRLMVSTDGGRSWVDARTAYIRNGASVRYSVQTYVAANNTWKAIFGPSTVGRWGSTFQQAGTAGTLTIHNGLLHWSPKQKIIQIQDSTGILTLETQSGDRYVIADQNNMHVRDRERFARAGYRWIGDRSPMEGFIAVNNSDPAAPTAEGSLFRIGESLRYQSWVPSVQLAHHNRPGSWQYGATVLNLGVPGAQRVVNATPLRRTSVNPQTGARTWATVEPATVLHLITHQKGVRSSVFKAGDDLPGSIRARLKNSLQDLNTKLIDLELTVRNFTHEQAHAPNSTRVFQNIAHHYSQINAKAADYNTRFASIYEDFLQHGLYVLDARFHSEVQGTLDSLAIRYNGESDAEPGTIAREIGKYFDTTGESFCRTRSVEGLAAEKARVDQIMNTVFGVMNVAFFSAGFLNGVYAYLPTLRNTIAEKRSRGTVEQWNASNATMETVAYTDKMAAGDNFGWIIANFAIYSQPGVLAGSGYSFSVNNEKLNSYYQTFHTQGDSPNLRDKFLLFAGRSGVYNGGYIDPKQQPYVRHIIAKFNKLQADLVVCPSLRATNGKRNYHHPFFEVSNSTLDVNSDIGDSETSTGLFKRYMNTGPVPTFSGHIWKRDFEHPRDPALVQQAAWLKGQTTDANGRFKCQYARPRPVLHTIRYAYAHTIYKVTPEEVSSGWRVNINLPDDGYSADIWPVAVYEYTREMTATENPAWNKTCVVAALMPWMMKSVLGPGQF